MQKKVAIVYDRVNKWGGAERVLLTLHKMFPEAPLYTSVYDEKGASWAKVFPSIKTSFLQKIPFAKTSHELIGWLMPFAFESFNFDNYDLVISVTSEAAKGVITKPGTKHICYCLTPTRYLWSAHEVYFRNPIIKFISKPIVKWLKDWDRIAAQRPDVIIAISTEVKRRIKRYYGRDAEKIYPPVEIKSQRLELRSKNPKFFLIVSRLVPYKKVDLAVKAFNKLKLPLVVVGTGSEALKLKLMAEKNIQFTGMVSEEELSGYYRNAKALIMPQEEDFGIVSVEAQSFGVPVIAYKKGGAIDTVIPDKTGIFFNEQKQESLMRAVGKFEKIEFKVDNLFINSKRFSSEIFKSRILELIKER